MVHLLTFTTKISTTCLLQAKNIPYRHGSYEYWPNFDWFFSDIPGWTSEGFLLPHVMGSWLKIPISSRPSWSSYVLARWHFNWWVLFLIPNLSRNKNTWFPSTKLLKQINNMLFLLLDRCWNQWSRNEYKVHVFFPAKRLTTLFVLKFLTTRWKPGENQVPLNDVLHVFRRVYGVQVWSSAKKNGGGVGVLLTNDQQKRRDEAV